MTIPASTAISLRVRSGINSTATMASRTGASHSKADTHDGAKIVRFCSTSASNAATISDTVTNCPEGRIAAAPMSAGEVSTNTVAPDNDP